MFYKLSKLIFIFFVFYVGWFQDFFFSIPNLPTVLGIGMFSFLILHQMLISKSVDLTITIPVYIWILFSFYVLLSGLFVAYDKSLFINSLMTYIQTLAIIIFIINIAVIERNNYFFIKSYFLFSVICMLSMLFFGYESRGGRLSLTEDTNPNGDALMLLMGVFCTLILFNTKRFIYLIASTGFVVFFVYTIILTGSRKSFLAVILLILLWLLITFIQYWKTYSFKNKIFTLILLLIPAVVIYKLIPSFLQTSLFSRISGGGYRLANDPTRVGMYELAMRYFQENPIFGIGFDQYRALSPYKTYSHSTYAEIISTTGIIGSLIYFIPYLIIIFNLIQIVILNRKNESSLKAMQYLILMGVLLILGTGVIHFYGINYNIMFALMISFYYTEKIKRNRNNKEVMKGYKND